MFWAPPWLLIPLSPLYFFDTLANQWIVFLGIASCFITLQAYIGSKISSNVFIGLISTLTTATYSSLAIGNAAFIPATGFSFFLYGIIKRSTFLTALGIALATTKPHLLFSFFIIFLITDYRFASQCITKICLLFFGMVSVSITVNGFEAHQYWIQSFFSQTTDISAVEKASWMCANFDGFLRTIIDLPYALRITLIGALNILLLFLVIHFKRLIKFPIDFIWLLPLCLFLAPYGWLYDAMSIQVCIAFSVLLAGKYIMDRKYLFIIISYALLQTLFIFYLLYIAKFQHEFWWYTPVQCILGLYIASRVRSYQTT
jgi:hypothetical protein